MKEWQKEWLGIKPADFIIYAGFLLLVPAYYSSMLIADVILLSIGFVLCLVSCWIGIKPHPGLGKTNNLLKVIAYPIGSLLFLYCAYLNFTAWQ